MLLFLVLFVPFVVTLFAYARFLNWLYDAIADRWAVRRKWKRSLNREHTRVFPHRW